jgi:hypothetical protein
MTYATTFALALVLGFIAGKKRGYRRGLCDGREAGYVNGRIDAVNEQVSYLRHLGARLAPMTRAEIN